MKTILILFGLAYSFILNSWGEQVDANDIKQLLQQVDSSLVQGHIYHINYSVSEKRTEAFYNFRKELIKLADKQLAIEAQQQGGSDTANGDKVLNSLKTAYLRELGRPRECTYTSDYSVDGTGFYLKQRFFITTCDGKKTATSPAIYASDGKITGIFYPNSAQAIIQPATERPQVPAEYWTDVAYRFSRKSISEYCNILQTIKMSKVDGKIVITGEYADKERGSLHVELQVDQASLLPQRMDSTYHNYKGVLDNEVVKEWQYQDVSGVKWPKVVIDQQYRTDTSGKLNLESEQTFAVNDLSFSPVDSKAELAALLKSNYSVFDQITGTHYLSGSPSSALDNLSK